MVRRGDVAPDFTLPGTGGRDYTLSAERGKPVVLAFYPGDDTPVCTVQLVAYNEDLAAFADLGAQLFGISPQDVASHEAFAAKYGFAFPLLADADKKVAEAYGTLGPLGFYRRAVYVVGPDGVVRYAHRSLTAASYVRAHQIEAAIRDAVEV